MGLPSFTPGIQPAVLLAVHRRLLVGVAGQRALTSADWENSTLITGDTAADEIAKLKQDYRLGVSGSVTLVRWLLEQRLLDELHLLVHPIIVGHGKRLFPDGATVPLQLLSSTAFASGVLHLVYAPADAAVAETAHS